MVVGWIGVDGVELRISRNPPIRPRGTLSLSRDGGW